jgi:catechol 2,3-dioxygenase-like lactoylglutathione lyase family enzyme
MRVLFVASVSPIVRDPASAATFYRDGLGLTFEGGGGDYVFTEKLEGSKHLGLWPLAEAAKSCFGTDTWPKEHLIPQASIEFEVDDVEAAASELERKGYRLVHKPRTEPWNQTIARLLTPEGLLIGLCYTPWLRDKK